jgi:4-hydroxybenzoate polyprenyltransferase
MSFLRKITATIQLLRPKQWVKNGFVLAPLLFAGEFLSLPAIKSSLFAVFLFCVASSATYIVNDIHDLEHDIKHPKKSKKRPLAAGLISVQEAIFILCGLYVILISGFLFVPQVIAVICAYLLLNLLYTFFLKHQPVLDIFCIAIGFVLRVVVGAIALDLPVSGWMLVTTLSLALYLAAVKRRQELSQSGTEGRKVLEKYSVSLVDRYAEMSATGALVFYSMFVLSDRPELVLTVPLVLFGIFRYWYVVEALDGGESPTDALIADAPLLFTVVLWIGTCAYVIWPAKG